MIFIIGKAFDILLSGVSTSGNCDVNKLLKEHKRMLVVIVCISVELVAITAADAALIAPAAMCPL